MLKTIITDGEGNGFSAKVDNQKALRVSPSGVPPLEVQHVIPFRQFLTDDGLSTGSNDMKVDGRLQPFPFGFRLQRRQTVISRNCHS